MAIRQVEKPVNIKELVLEESIQKERYVFRPEDEISEDDFDSIRKFIVKDPQGWNFLQLAYETSVLFPAKKEDLGIGDWTTVIIANEMKSYKDAIREGLPSIIRNYKAFFNLPTTSDLSAINIDINDMRGIYATLMKKVRRKEFPQAVLDSLVAYKLLYPSEYEDFGVNDASQEQMISAAHNAGLETGMRMAARIKILLPSFDIRTAFSDSDIAMHYKNFLALKSQGQWGLVAEEAFSLYILTAEKVETEDGKLKVTLPDKFQSATTTPTLPETRRF